MAGSTEEAYGYQNRDTPLLLLLALYIDDIQGWTIFLTSGPF